VRRVYGLATGRALVELWCSRGRRHSARARDERRRAASALRESGSVTTQIGPSSSTAAWRRGCRVIPAGCVAAVEISIEPAVSALGVTAERDGLGPLLVAVGDIHTAESFPDSLRHTR
jgi:hypothetical protein